MSDELIGRVVRLLSEDELIINVGSDQGVRENQIFEVLDPRTIDVRDPNTGRDLGSIHRTKVRLRVTETAPKMAIAQVFPLRREDVLSSTAIALSGRPKVSRPSPDRWPEGVEVRDPVRFTGKTWAPKS